MLVLTETILENVSECFLDMYCEGLASLQEGSVEVERGTNGLKVGLYSYLRGNKKSMGRGGPGREAGVTSGCKAEEPTGEEYLLGDIVSWGRFIHVGE